jgi:hypothetical protein
MNIGKTLFELIAKEGKSFRGTAMDMGVDRSSLYRSLKKGNPEWKTMEKLLDYLGYEIRIVKSGRKRNDEKRVKQKCPRPSRTGRNKKGGYSNEIFIG